MVLRVRCVSCGKVNFLQVRWQWRNTKKLGACSNEWLFKIPDTRDRSTVIV